jgi:PUA-domain protein
MKKQLSKHDLEEFQSSLKSFHVTFTPKDHIDYIEDDAGRRWTVNQQPAFIATDAGAIPHLRYLLTHDILKKIVVDMGAVKFVVAGADVMRPGIKEFAPNIAKDDIVVVVDINNKKPLAVGKMLLSGADASAAASGKVVKNLHWVGDKFWNQA